MNVGTPHSAAPLDDSVRETLLKEATDPGESRFDYIIVGSGAGGGPLAARLAEGGRRVLVLEAGTDPTEVISDKGGENETAIGEVTKVPGYYAAASEDKDLSWMFSVRHHADDAKQVADPKYNRSKDPNTGGSVPKKFLDPHPKGGKQGIFYPRSTGIGGCTAHHAMITICPNDQEWNDIANLTGDPSWRAGAMRGYFAKFERNQYVATYGDFLRKFLGIFYKLWRWIWLLLDPRAVLDNGGHGFKGWAPTNLLDPFLVSTIAGKDQPFIKAIARAALGVLHGKWPMLQWLKQQLLKSRVVEAVDFNDINTRRANPEGVFLIPLGIAGKEGDRDRGEPAAGRRFGVREFLLNTQFKYPDRLIIRSGVHVTRVLFSADPEGGAPIAIGVECAPGEHLYEASPVQKSAPEERICFFARKGGEIILSGGAFNTPQLLMLSGMGPKDHLAQRGVTGLAGAEKKDTGSWQTIKKPILPVINLPGVGSNLQDRYEVTVVSELDQDFATLEGVSFIPGDKNDPARTQWFNFTDNKKRGDGAGLYGTNGGTLAVIRRSKVAMEEGETRPDLFTFGAPAAFRGYYWNWSRELFKADIDALGEKRRLWTWVILKAYTHNNGGTVRLRTNSPFDLPEVCFDVFNEAAEQLQTSIQDRLKQKIDKCNDYIRAGKAIPPSLKEARENAEKDWAENQHILEDSKRDLAAMVDAVAFMRKVNAGNKKQFVHEIQPGEAIADHSAAMEEWIRTGTWGHHCSCTCRMGGDSWQADTSNLLDRGAVLDSRFQVHGVKGLRIVDASVFPKIPGYFILAPIFMISEKAADTLLQDALAQVYPASFESEEAKSIRARRVKAGLPVDPDGKTSPGKLPAQTVGLALSGGGIRSSTFALGVLQTLAAKNRLRHVDILSTVSGGGFIGSFVGRLFTRETVKRAADPCARVQETLKNTSSAPLYWLRTQANYIFATGSSDLQLNLAVLWRNLFAVYLVAGALVFTGFGLLAFLPQAMPGLLRRMGGYEVSALYHSMLTAPVIHGIILSPWWWLPVLALGLFLIPATLGYWLAPKVGSYRPYPLFSLLAWLALLTGALIGLRIPQGGLYAGGVAGILLLSWFSQEAARWGAIRGANTEVARQKAGSVVRNRIVRSVGEILFIFLGLAVWVALDTLALFFAREGWTVGITIITGAVMPFMPLLQKLATRAKKEASPGDGGFSFQRAASLLGIPLAILFLLVVDVHAHRLFIQFPGCGWGLMIIIVTGAFSAAIGRSFDFLNLSSLQATYAARLVRTFQGASNEERVYASSSSEGHDVGIAHPLDDIAWHDYHPEHQGGPLHFVNVTVNETVDAASERELRERKGLPMCITPHGVSVGRRYFARWSQPDALPFWQRLRRWMAGVDGADAQPFLPWTSRPGDAAPPAATALSALPVSSDPNQFHVLKTKNSENAEVESRTLGEWIGISGAAFSTGVGRDTKLATALFMGLVNIRLGYWWDSGIHEGERPGQYPQSLWRRIKRFPVSLFRSQSMLFAEWRGRFHGASRWFWYLSDGGHFEVTGLYEMLRRRLPFMIVSDAGADLYYQWNDVSLLTQQVREDFGAEIEWQVPQKAADGQRLDEWYAFRPAPPDWIQEWIRPKSIGALNDIQRQGTHHAALARVTYAFSDDISWILLLKPGLDDSLTEDLINYGNLHSEFPQTPTFDQVFDDIQWESHRAIGQQIAGQVLR